MKAKGLLTAGAILLMVIAIGCSNGSRTTAPVNSTDIFTLPNGTDISRIENGGSSVPTIESTKPTWVAVRGIYSFDQFGCVSLQLNKYDYIELSFIVNSPIDIANGTPVEIRGNYSLIPGTRCQLPKRFIVTSITALTDNHTPPPPSMGGDY
jgi:hypothetical protein